MKLVKFKNVSAVINLTWHALPNDQSERAAQKAIMEQNKGVKAGVLVKYGGVALLGLGPVGAKVINGPSAAAWLSIANQKAMDQGGSAGLPNTGSGSTNDWIVVENLGDGTFWLAIIRDGVPLPGTDVVLDRETTLELIQEAVETAPFVVYSPDEGIRGDVPTGTMVDSKGFADLVQGTKPGKSAMRAVSGVSVKALAIIGAILLLGVAWMGWTYYSQQQEAKRLLAQSSADAAEQQRRIAADKAQYAVDVKKAVDQALDQGVIDLNNILSNPSANEVINSWVNLVSDTSANQGGWNIGSFSCTNTEESVPSCVVSMTRGEYSTNRILMEDHPDAILDGDSATFTITGQSSVKRSGDYKRLERANTFSLDFISDLQMLKFADVGYNIAESQDVTSTISMPPVPSSIFKPGDTAQAPPAPAPIRMGAASGDLTFTGSHLWQVEGLREFLARENIAVQSLDLSISSGVPGNWTLKASYYIRNAPEPILPVITGPDQEVITVSLPDKYKASPEELESWAPGSSVAASGTPAPPAESIATQGVSSPEGSVSPDASPSGEAPEVPELNPAP